MYNTRSKSVFNKPVEESFVETAKFFTFSTEFSTLFEECLNFQHCFPPFKYYKSYKSVL